MILQKSIIVLAIFMLASAAPAEVKPGRPYASVVYDFEERARPPQRIYIARINLADPKVQVEVSPGGPDPDGDGKWQTTLMPPTKIAEREGYDIVINGDFFSHFGGRDAEGAAAQKEFQHGTPARVTGPAETRGHVWATTRPARPTFMIDSSKHPSIERLEQPPSGASEAIGGSHLLVKSGRNVAPPADKPGFVRGPHPRTAVGVGDGGKMLILVVVDGRKKGRAIGMSLPDLADVMIKYGATDAINLDGGGSSVMAMRDPATHRMQILNQPSDGRERSVADVLGVRLAAKK
jgi:hypothetical protein